MATTKHVETTVDSRGKTREVEVFVFHNPAKRKRDDKDVPEKKAKVPAPKPKMDVPWNLESVRGDVRNFAISGLEGNAKIEAKMSQLKSLGAKIPKNWERKLDKRRRNEEYQRRKQDLKAGMKHKKLSDPKKSVQRTKAEQERKKKKKEEVFFDGIGKYKDGVQYISRADILNMKNRTKIRSRRR